MKIGIKIIQKLHGTKMGCVGREAIDERLVENELEGNMGS